MTAIANYRMHTEFVGDLPRRGTAPMAANTLLYGKALVSLNASGNAVSPTDGDGLPVYGVASATYDNRTGSEAGGLAGDLDAEVEFGVFGFDYVSADGVPAPGDRLYAVDNQTVSVDSDGGARGFAGVCTESRLSALGVAQTYLMVSPISEALGASSGPFTSIPIGMAPAFANGTANGIDPTVFGFRLNNAVDDQPFLTCVAIPPDRDPAADLVITARAYIIDDATDDDVVMVLVARVDGGSDVAPVSATVLGETAADITFAIPAADVPAGSKSLYLELDCAATLDTSDAVVESLSMRSIKTAAV
jgi:hypothetical protein